MTQEIKSCVIFYVVVFFTKKMAGKLSSLPFFFKKHQNYETHYANNIYCWLFSTTSL